MTKTLNNADETLTQLVESVDAYGGKRVLDAKQYSLQQLKKQGYSNAQIETLINVKLT